MIKTVMDMRASFWSNSLAISTVDIRWLTLGEGMNTNSAFFIIDLVVMVEVEVVVVEG